LNSVSRVSTKEQQMSSTIVFHFISTIQNSQLADDFKNANNLTTSSQNDSWLVVSTPPEKY
jgi:hypothetical protein